MINTAGRGQRRMLSTLPSYLTAVALLLAWLARLGSAVGLPTTVPSNLDLVLIPVALGLVVLVRRDALSGFVPMLVAGGIFLVSAGVGGVSSGLPLVQVAIGASLYAVPFMAFLVVATDPDRAGAQRMLWVVAGTIAVQLPVVAAQWLRHGMGDEVRGTLLGAGAGAHLVGAAALVGAALVWVLRGLRPVSVVAAVTALLVVIATDAKQVGAVVPIVAVIIVALRLGARGISPRRLLVAAAGVLVALAIPILWLLSKTYVANIFQLTLSSGGGKIAVARTLWADIWSGPPLQSLVGFGPGETVSRWAWTLSGLDPSSAPLRTLGIEAGGRAIRYQEAALGQGYVGESSFTQSLSSLLGVLGDYGVIGVIGYVGMLALMSRVLIIARSRLAALSLGMIVALVTLGAIGDWLEQTPIMVMVMVLGGAAVGTTVRTTPATARCEEEEEG